MNYINKDILTIEKGFIFQQVNCQGVMGGGLAKQIADKWPKVVQEYKDHIKYLKDPKYALGTYSLSIVDKGLVVVNIFGQYDFGTDKCHTDYQAIRTALNKFLSMVAYNDLQQDSVFYFPYKMGCGLGGGDWEIYEKIIEKYFPNATICKYEPLIRWEKKMV